MLLSEVVEGLGSGLLSFTNPHMTDLGFQSRIAHRDSRSLPHARRSREARVDWAIIGGRP